MSAARDLARLDEPTERPRRVAALLAALSDTAAEVRKQALLSLAEHKAVEALERVTALLADPELSVRPIALLALGEIAEPGDSSSIGRALGLLSAGDPALRYQALIAVVRLSAEDARRSILATLADRDRELRALSLRLLEESLLAEPEQPADDELCRAIVRATTDPEPRVALVAQLMAGELGLQAPLDAVVALVNGRMRAAEPRDEQVAVELCGRLRLPAAVPGLRRRARGRLGLSFDPFRYQALAGLVALGDSRARARLEKALRRGKRGECTLAVFAVGQVELLEFAGELEQLRGLEQRVDQPVLAEALERLEQAERPASAG